MAGQAEPLFRTADVDEMRQLSDSSLDCTLDVYRPNDTTVGPGGTIRRYAGNPPPVLSSVPCRYALLNAQQRVIADQLAPDAQWQVTFPTGVDVRLGDHLFVHGVVRSNDTPIGAGDFVDTPYTQPMKVVGVREARSYMTLFRVLCAPLAPSES